MKKLLVLLFVLISVCASAQSGGLIYYQDSSATDTLKMIPVSDLNPLPSSASIGSITMETNITPVTDWATQTVTLVANTAQTITTNITATNRRFIELKAHTPTDEFWVDFGADAVINASRPCQGYVYLELPIDIDLSVIASTAFDIAVTEGGDD